MIDLCITGTLKSDILEFTVGDETKAIDRFSNSVHFSLEPKQTYRIYFEQKREQYIPRPVEIVLNLLLLPIRGLFNVITFNVDQAWEKEISAFKASGYIDINLETDTELSFEYKSGSFDKSQKYFYEPTVLFSSEYPTNQKNIADDSDIRRKHINFVQNVISVGIWFYLLFIFLLVISIKYSYHIAFAIVLSVIVIFSILIASLLINSFRKKKQLISALSKQNKHKE